jgi:hypothetical protein
MSRGSRIVSDPLRIGRDRSFCRTCRHRGFALRGRSMYHRGTSGRWDTVNRQFSLGPRPTRRTPQHLVLSW